MQINEDLGIAFDDIGNILCCGTIVVNKDPCTEDEELSDSTKHVDEFLTLFLNLTPTSKRCLSSKNEPNSSRNYVRYTLIILFQSSISQWLH